MHVSYVTIGFHGCHLLAVGAKFVTEWCQSCSTKSLFFKYLLVFVFVCSAIFNSFVTYIIMSSIEGLLSRESIGGEFEVHGYDGVVFEVSPNSYSLGLVFLVRLTLWQPRGLATFWLFWASYCPMQLKRWVWERCGSDGGCYCRGVDILEAYFLA